jgi:hypothetical protein
MRQDRLASPSSRTPHPAATSAKHPKCHDVFIGFRQVSFGVQESALRLLGRGGSGNCRTEAQSSDLQSMTRSNNLGQFLSGLVWCNDVMATGQIWLFPPPRPLVERFGEDFFHALPTKPGVISYAVKARGVYVGKSDGAGHSHHDFDSISFANQSRNVRLFKTFWTLPHCQRPQLRRFAPLKVMTFPAPVLVGTFRRLSSFAIRW